ncbi:hypothetical protein AB0E21_29045 [Streptomyces sp. NPDC047967]|uniref:hypothetical protein n=1 Tax=Streptomyces sp. NPDC047967 TaxID=3154924 RepID=UPI0033F895F7
MAADLLDFVEFDPLGEPLDLPSSAPEFLNLGKLVRESASEAIPKLVVLDSTCFLRCSRDMGCCGSSGFGVTPARPAGLEKLAWEISSLLLMGAADAAPIKSRLHAAEKLAASLRDFERSITYIPL